MPELQAKLHSLTYGQDLTAPWQRCHLVWVSPISVEDKDPRNPMNWIRNNAGAQKYKVVFICAHHSGEPGHEPAAVETILI